MPRAGIAAPRVVRSPQRSRAAESFLKALPVFATLPAREVAGLAAVAREEGYRARDYVFMEGDQALWFCLVKTGRVKIVRHSRTGKDVVLELLGPGEVFGGVAVIEQRPYPAAAQAIEPTVVLKIPAGPIVALTEHYPAVIKELALTIGRRLRAAHDSVKALAVDPVEARLAARLLRLAEREGTRGPPGLALPFHLTRQSLADMTGTTVETAIRVVSRWQRDGLVADDGGRLVVRDVEALRERAGGEGE
jgi:CRP/FNR family transcriptional regulator, nitrogen oxide reductase regulator